MQLYLAETKLDLNKTHEQYVGFIQNISDLLYHSRASVYSIRNWNM